VQILKPGLISSPLVHGERHKGFIVFICEIEHYIFIHFRLILVYFGAFYALSSSELKVKRWQAIGEWRDGEQPDWNQGSK